MAIVYTVMTGLVEVGLDRQTTIFLARHGEMEIHL